MNLLGEYINGNYGVKIFDDGTKIRENELDNLTPSFPENIDIKITDYCDRGCAFCHENSTVKGIHGDILNQDFIKTLSPFTELACLSGDSVVYGNTGAVEIKDLSVGDYIFDSEHILRKITQINKSKKESLILKSGKGFSAISSKDHPFVSEGKYIEAQDMEGKQLTYLSKFTPQNKENNYNIDLSKYIKNSNKKLNGSRGGKKIDEKSIRIRNCTPHVPKNIKLTNELMWLYGLFVAEGSKKGITLNINEKDIANKVIKIWKDNFGLNCRTYLCEDRHSMSIEFETVTLIEDLFINEFKIGKGARNKSISYLFSLNNKELVRQGILGLFDGDGSYRTRKNKFNSSNYSASLKTTSKKLAYEVLYLFSKWFGVYGSIYHGLSKERKIENRILKESDYYMIEIYGRENVNKIFFDRFNMVKPIQNQIKEKSTRNVLEIKEGNIIPLYDITLDGGSHIFPINGYVLTHNCGGGNPLDHPDLVEFLKELRERKIIANVTVNQKHFIERKDFINYLVSEKLIYGLGVSVTEVTDELISLLQENANIVIHVIYGVIEESELKKLYDKGLKVLILGYKIFRRGETWYNKNDNIWEVNANWMFAELPEMTRRFKVVSFDNLAIRQLEVKRLMSEKKWNDFYMGDDGQYTMYIDMVKKEFASSSTSTQRLPVMNEIVEMFNIVRNQN